MIHPSFKFVFCAFYVLILISCGEQTKKEAIEDTVGAHIQKEWVSLGPGGGGHVYVPTISPHDSGHVFVSCDMTSSFATENGGESWRMFNLRGVISFYVFDPNDENVVYAQSSSLYKSSDKGKTWSLLYPDAANIKRIVGRRDHSDEFIENHDGLQHKVHALAVDPANSKKLYAAIQIGGDLFFSISKNGGKQWAKVWKLTGEVKNIYIDPSSSQQNRTIYITQKNTIKVFKNGQWKTNKGPKGVENLTSYTSGYSKDSKKFILYAMSGKSFFNRAGDKSGIYYTEDGGQTWENRENGLLSYKMNGSETPTWDAIATSENHPNILYVSYARLRVDRDSLFLGVARSKDYGMTWQLVWKDNVNKDEGTVTPNMQDGWLNEMFGPWWGENPTHLGVDSNNPEIVYTTDYGRVIKTIDGGETWKQIYTKRMDKGWASTGLQVTTVYSVEFDPFDQDHLLMPNTDIGLMQSFDGGKSWRTAVKDNGVPDRWVNTAYWVAFDPDIKDKIWAVMSNVHDLPRPKMWRKRPLSFYKGGILLSNDGGVSWQPISGSIGEAAFTHILIDEDSDLQNRTLYACAFGKGVYKSKDNGKTWHLKNIGIEEDEPMAWRIVENKFNDELFLIISRRSEDGSIGNSMDGAIYRSKDGAESWVKMTLPDGVNAPTSLLIDPVSPNRITISTWGKMNEGQFSPDTGGGIFQSNDDGATWTHVLQKDQHIHDLTIDLRNNVYYACGFNSSAYRSENSGRTWNRIKGYNFKWAKRVDIDPRTTENIFISTFGGGVWFGPAKGVVGSVEDIRTPIMAY